MYVVIVNVSVKPEAVTAFVEATNSNLVGTRQEPLNVRFDLLQREDDPNRFVIYEVYQGQAGFSAHQQTAHYLKWRETVAPMMSEPRAALKCVSVLPEPWQ